MNLWKDMRPPLVTSLVTTTGKDGTVNASPKTWWTPISYQPPALILATKPGSDTSRNIDETGMFVLHLPPQHLAKEVLHTAKPLLYGKNELDDQNLPWEFLEDDHLDRPMPYLPGIPWLVCWAMSKMEASPGADHHVYIAQIGMAGGFDAEYGVGDVLLHGSRNTFVKVGGAYSVEAY